MLYFQKTIRKKLFDDVNYQKAKNHCHYTGKYRGPAHSICSLKFNLPNEIPAVLIMDQNTITIL